MANRNENLKKINDELEKLTDEQLDAVSGGFVSKKSPNILRMIEEGEREKREKRERKEREELKNFAFGKMATDMLEDLKTGPNDGGGCDGGWGD